MKILTFLNETKSNNEMPIQDLLTDAIFYATEKHKSQHRKGEGNIPYINHPITVMRLVNMAGVSNLNVLAAAVLHDTVEDTDATLDDISQRFGVIVRNIVEEVTDDKSLSKIERKKAQIERIRTASDGAKLIKIADKISNVFDACVAPPVGWKLDDIKMYACWSMEVVRAAEVSGNTPNGWLCDLFWKVFSKNICYVQPLIYVVDKDVQDMKSPEFMTYLERYYASLERK